MTKGERENREYQSLYSDERFAKKAWKDLIGKSLEGSARPLIVIDPKSGEVTPQSKLEQMAWDNVKARLRADGLDRDPQQAEMLIECNIIKTRGDNGTFNTILDRTAGKVKDEISITNNPFEELTDDELEALAAYRENKTAEVTDG